MTHRQDEIEMFCCNFLHGNRHKQLHELIDNYDCEFSQIDIEQFTKDTFDSSFRSTCNDAFTCRLVSNGYIIAILGFAEAIHKHHCSSSWYSIDTLTNSLVNALEGIGFHPEPLAPRCNIYIVTHSEIFIHLHADY